MTAWNTGVVDVDGLRLHYTRSGNSVRDKPPVILAHGVTDDGPCWTAIAQELSDDYDLIMTDARGHGRSDAPEEGYGSDKQADDLAAVIRALGLTKPAVVGHSMGAATTLVMAGTYPDLPGTIVLEDPPTWWLPADTGGDDQRRAGMLEWFTAIKRQTNAELLAGITQNQPNWSEVEVATWVESKQRFSPNVLSLLQPGASSHIDWTGTLGQITCPATLIYSDPERGGIVTAEAAEALRAIIPHLKIEHIGEAGHNIRRDQPEQFIKVVRAALSTWTAGKSA